MKLELNKHKSKGLFISFDGIDGSGKSSLIDLTCKYFNSNNKKYFVIKMPSLECREISYFKEYLDNPIDFLYNKKLDLLSLSIICLGDRLMTVRTKIFYN